MSKLEDLQPGLRLAGVIPGQNVAVIAVQPHGADAIELTYKTGEGELGQRVLGRDAEAKLAIAQAEARPLDAPAADFKLVAECQRIKLAGLWDPMLAVTTSDIQPLPHQLRAVYGELLPRTPLRFLLADDPGAGKTIMAGLYIKELILREDVKRCLIVVPGGLVDQWQDELYLKFGLAFEILTPQFGETVFGASAFEQHPLLIARMDQLARNESLQAELAKSEWDLVVVDEAHRMGAHYFAGKLEKTKRFQLGELLGDVARHLLLMTATPHSGKEEDFQLFLTLLDRDRFEGKYQAKVHSADTSGVMRRMVKEDLLTFDGKPLFPERIAETVPYELTELEQDLYEQVTTYVREGMNRAAKLDGKRRNTVGFALTVLQRRLASSPEAIYRSLERRAARLERRKQEVLAGSAIAEPKAADVIGDIDEFDDDEFSAEEMEEFEEELVDAATAARTVEELDAELLDLADLIKAAARVRASDTDRKWSELRTILEDNTLATSGAGDERRKLIVFTEHRDTLDYLVAPDRLAARPARGGQGDPRRRAPRRAPADHRGVHPQPGRPDPARHRRRRGGPEPPGRAPDGQLRPAVEPEPDRAALRPHPPHRPATRSAACGTSSPTTRARAMCSRGCWPRSRSSARPTAARCSTCSARRSARRRCATLLIDAIRYGELPETKANMEKVIDAGVARGHQGAARRARAGERRDADTPTSPSCAR